MRNPFENDKLPDTKPTIETPTNPFSLPPVNSTGREADPSVLPTRGISGSDYTSSEYSDARSVETEPGPRNGSSGPPPPYAEYRAQESPYGSPRPREKSWLEKKKEGGGIVGTIAGIVLLILKFLAPLKGLIFLAKPALLVFSGFASTFFYSTQFGWPMAIGFVLLIFVHEMGHVWAAKKLGLETGWVAFIPFMGALMTTKRNTDDAAQGAFLGIMGPVFGGAAAILVTIYGLSIQSPFFVSLGEIGCWLNLFNLAPVFPLDGGWVAGAIDPKLWALGMVILLILRPLNPLLWLIVILSIPRMIQAWRKDPKTQQYYAVPVKTRFTYLAAYLLLAGILFYFDSKANSWIQYVSHGVNQLT